jgi:DNA-binding response OmpR family regulator/HPt (histidine-containing phosphotransfer) domain-containing protein
VTYGDRPLVLTTKEYELLELLLRDSQRVLSADEILDNLWSSEEFPAEATVRSHMRRLRHKLSVVGAPADFIATIHGRGYYLKSIAQKTSVSPISTAPRLPDTVQTVARDRQQIQYLAFLNETWVAAKPKSLNQLIVLLQITKALKASSLSPEQQEHAQHIAHQLAGTLGTFGLTQAMQLARRLEQWLSSHQPLQSQHAPLMKELITALQQQIQSTHSIAMANVPPHHLPLLLILDTVSPFTEALTQAAEQRGIRTVIAPTLEAAQAVLNAESATEATYPSVVLIRQPAAPQIEKPQRHWAKRSELLATLQFMAQHHPNLPTLVVSQHSMLEERLDAIRQGGKLFLEESTTPEQILTAVVQLMSGAERETKVMVVDDDQDWLRTLPPLLNPWGFKVTTLADPQQFWSVLQAVTPDILLLDVNMPQFNGFELCQVLRSDFHWQRLPILFVSVLTDLNAQNYAFSVGADDYLCKPIMGVDLAKRILNRLQRVQAWAS